MPEHLRNVLVGVDFSAASETAFAQAARIAAWGQARLHAAHVVELFSLTDIRDSFEVAMTGTHKAYVEAAAAKWASFAAGRLGRDAAEFSVAVDETVTGLCRAARELKADLLVLGSVSKQRGGLVDPVASGCAQRSPCDVLIVRHPHASAFKSVLACVDFTPASFRALERASRIAVADGAVLHVAHAYAAPWKAGDAPGPDGTFERAYEQGLVEQLQAFCRPLGEMPYLQPRYAVVGDKRAATGLARLAADLRADLIVMGTRGRGNLHDLVLGSTAERMLGLSPCAVLAVRPPCAQKG